ncbi:MAG: class I SAM-dependent methyltransferase [Pseudomonadales bacterium]|nr:class I SAM-dependent methyltransferase [Pseudomonadales bacterium]
MNLGLDIESVKGFLHPEEGAALYEHCLQAARSGPVLEVGSYCGKSTVYLGAACKVSGRTLYAVDHHRGSEEHQLGEEYHDPEVYDQTVGLVDTFRLFRQTMRAASLEETVVPVVASTAVAARDWQTPLGMVFIDGGHSFAAAQTDYECWTPHILAGGILAIHDIFPDPADGGQAPYTIWKQALDSGLFEDLGIVNTLGFLRRYNS